MMNSVLLVVTKWFDLINWSSVVGLKGELKEPRTSLWL